MNIRLFVDLGKYLLAVGLLSWVVWANWTPTAPPRAVASLATSLVGLLGSPAGGLLGVSALVPGRLEPPGLGYVWHHHIERAQPVRLNLLLAALGIYGVALVLTLLRWYLLVRALGLSLSLVEAFRFGLIGIFFNTFLPGAVGGDIIKAAALARAQVRRTASVATVLMDRAIALWALVWFVALLGGSAWCLGWLEGPRSSTAFTILRFAWILAGVSGLGWLLLGYLPARRADRFAERLTRLPWVGNAAAEFWRSVWMYRNRQATIALVMLITWVGQVGFLSSFYLGLMAFWSPVMGPVPSYVQHFLLVPMGLVMQALVPTPGGAGGGEWSFGALYLLFGAAEANGVLASLVQRLFSWLVGLIGYGFYLWYRPAVEASQTEQPIPAAPATLEPTARVVAG
ncbi:MAG: lysylphosphatidylglycerol synthase transmembrane domain-containing protein [Gemmataceae bacterium]